MRNVRNKTRMRVKARCRLCDGETASYLTFASFFLSRCLNCDFLQVDNEPTCESIKELYGESYFLKAKYSAEFSQRQESQRRLNLLRRFVAPEKGPVLETGCGTGDFLLSAIKEYDVSGCDYSAAAIENLKKTHPEFRHKVWSSSLEKTELPHEKYAAVLGWDVIEHLWDVRNAAHNMFNAVRPGGYLFLSTPDAGSLSAKLFKKRWAFFTVPEHLSFFSLPAFRQLFVTELGGEIVYARSRGKWVSLGFLIYKMTRVLPLKGISRVARWVTRLKLDFFPVYVPAGDILYAVIRKKP